MASAKWKFILANSKDLSHIGELKQARQRQVTMTHNQPGNANFTIPMNADLADSIVPLATCVKTYRTGTTGLKLPWSGYVSTIDENANENTMTVSCIGWQQRLALRLLAQDMAFPYLANTSTDDGEIIRQLLAQANLTTGPDGYAVPVVAGSSPNTPTWIAWGGTVPNEGPGGATAYVPAYRGKTYSKWQNINQAIDDLTTIENGCDVWVSPDTRLLYVYRKRRVIQPGAVFGFHWGPNNLKDFGRQIDSTTVVNREIVSGRYGLAVGDDGVGHPSQNAYGLIEEQQSLSDVVDPPPPASSILAAYANAEVLVKQQPRVIYTVTPFPYTIGGRVPEPFVDYNVGDQASLTARYGARINIQNQPVRIFQIQVGIDEEGNEQLGQLQLNAS